MCMIVQVCCALHVVVIGEPMRFLVGPKVRIPIFRRQGVRPCFPDGACTARRPAAATHFAASACFHTCFFPPVSSMQLRHFHVRFRGHCILHGPVHFVAAVLLVRCTSHAPDLGGRRRAPQK